MSAALTVEVLDRDLVARVADMLGPASAAAQALACVQAQHGGLAQVCRPEGSSSLIVIPDADLHAAG